MSHLSEQQLAVLYTALELRRRVLLRELAEHQPAESVEAALEDDGRAVERDRDPTPEMRNVARAESTRDRVELAAVQAALARFDDGSYGVCVDCGEEIPFARLEAQPFAARCIACQTRSEGGGESAAPAR